MRRSHGMPFGASADGDGTLFRLWAPNARQVALRLEQTQPDLPMAQRGGGWFELRAHGVGPGALYRFVVDSRAVPDPASRYQPRDVDGPSEVIDATAFDWHDESWHGRPWYEAVICEIHLGTFTRPGTFAAATHELDRLCDLGVTAIELMPLSDFAGSRNWGYDGVLPFAPDSTYGRPEELKALICQAHRLGLMVLIDVVYNHFGPEGNYLPLYAPSFFSRRQTAWGQAIDFSGMARQYFVENALFWLIEYHADGLRLDAAHAIEDASTPHFLEELAQTARARCAGRQIHLVLENDRNEAHHLRRGSAGQPIFYDAQWNDDFHHAMHVILTGETTGYYADFASAPVEKLARCLAQGFAYQGEHSIFRGAPRGEASAGLPPLAFVNFLQNHDQIGNRAFGERLTRLASREALTAATAILLLAPSPPLLFMGDETGALAPFFFFCDFAGKLADAVRRGRRAEFASFPAFAPPDARAAIPDPLSPATFARSSIAAASSGPDPATVALYRRLLDTRRREIAPRLRGGNGFAAGYETSGRVVEVYWRLPDGSLLSLIANLSDVHAAAKPRCTGRLIWDSRPDPNALSPWAVIWALEAPP